MRFVIAASVWVASVGLGSSLAHAQTVYEPPRIQYGGSQPYYYAGSDPAVHAAARFPEASGSSWGRFDGVAFAGDRRVVRQQFARVFTDAFGVRDARPFGMTIDDVANESAARVPRYFRKADATAPAVAGRVASKRGSIVIIPYRPRAVSPRRAAD